MAVAVKLEPETPFSSYELTKIKKQNPTLKFRTRKEGDKQFIYITVDDETNVELLPNTQVD